MDKFIIVDWGTTHCRIEFCQEDGVSERERIDYAGVKTIYQDWISAGKPERWNYYLGRLESIWKQWDRCDVFIIGMASSSLGIESLPYAPIPISLDSPKLVVHKKAFANRSIYLFSGCTNGEDVMRGEEMQVIGMPELSQGWVVLPGTHSKHVQVANGVMQDFKTYCTGELFQVINQHTSIVNTWDQSNYLDDSFEEGIHAGQKLDWSHQLFKIRAKSVLGLPVSPASYVSGLLIGAELSQITHQKEAYLYCPEPLRRYYIRAAQYLELDFQVIPEESMENALFNSIKKWRKKN